MSQLFLNPTTYCYATNVASVTPGYAAALAAAHSVLNNSCSTCMATSLIAAVARATAAASPKGVPTGDDGPLLNVWSDAGLSWFALFYVLRRKVNWRLGPDHTLARVRFKLAPSWGGTSHRLPNNHSNVQAVRQIPQELTMRRSADRRTLRGASQ